MFIWFEVYARMSSFRVFLAFLLSRLSCFCAIHAICVVVPRQLSSPHI